MWRKKSPWWSGPFLPCVLRSQSLANAQVVPREFVHEEILVCRAALTHSPPENLSREKKCSKKTGKIHSPSFFESDFHCMFFFARRKTFEIIRERKRAGTAER